MLLEHEPTNDSGNHGMGDMAGSCCAKVDGLSEAGALGLQPWPRDSPESNPLIVLLPTWHNTIHAAFVSSSLESPVRLHGISMPPQTALRPRPLVTGGTAPPMTTGTESADHVVLLLHGRRWLGGKHRWKRGEQPNGYEGVAHEWQVLRGGDSGKEMPGLRLWLGIDWGFTRWIAAWPATPRRRRRCRA